MSPDERRRRNTERMNALRLRDPDRAVDARLRHAFNITLAEYDALLADQGGACAICETTSPGGMGRFHVDHDHACCDGKKSCGRCVRALLCTRCNAMLGMAGDNADLLNKAIDYLKEHGVRRAA